MTEPDLRQYVERARTAAAADLSLRNTELKLVQPLLAELGWDVHGPDAAAEVGVPADRDPVNYGLRIDGRPAVFVDVVACGEPLREADARRLGAALSAAGVDRGLLTNGRSFVFLDRAGARDECRLDELPDHPDAVTPYTRAAAEARVGTRAERRAAAERIAARRDEVVEDVTERLVATADGAAAGDLAAAADRFVDDLLAALGDDAPAAVPDEWAATPGEADATAEGSYAPPDESNGTSDESNVPPGERVAPANDAETAAGDDRGQGSGESDDAATVGASASPTAPGSDDGPTAGAAAASGTDETGEYIVRFFSGRTSVGAVGTDTATGATAAAIEYLIEQHALDAGLSLPWRPEAADDDGRAVLNHDPAHPSGAPMDASERLSNGYHLLATLDAPSARTVVAELADEAGLRPMFQGDW